MLKSTGNPQQTGRGSPMMGKVSSFGGNGGGSHFAQSGNQGRRGFMR